MQVVILQIADEPADPLKPPRRMLQPDMSRNSHTTQTNQGYPNISKNEETREVNISFIG